MSDGLRLLTALETPLLPLLQPRSGDWLHLPSHGRGRALPGSMRRLLKGPAGSWDLPELPQIGGPLESDGAVAASQAAAAEAYGAERCWYGVNGATGLLQAALLAMASPGQAVLMPRNVHRSLIQACVLGGITPVLFDLPFLADRGHVAGLDAAWLERVLLALESLPLAVVGAVLVQPTYHGYAVDPHPMVNALQARELPVLVDEAHGSHLLAGVDPQLPQSALHAGADLVVHSLHKSSTALGQSAVLWCQGRRIDPEQVDRSLGWLQTSSPSALLLASCEASLADWQMTKGRARLRRRLDQGRALQARLRRAGVPLLSTTDPLRLILHTAAAGLSGLEVDHWMMQRGVVAELPEPGCLTFCMGFARHRGFVRRIVGAWRRLSRNHAPEAPLPSFMPPPLPLLSTPTVACGEAWRAESRMVDWPDAVGSLSSQLVCPYPPGIPLLIPGERLDRDRVSWIMQQRQFWPDQISSKVRIVA